MKKLLFALVLFAASLTASAQSELVTYEIDTTGISNGLIIPAPFYVTVTEFSLTKTEGSFQYISYVQTYQDTANVLNIKNDNVSSSKAYPITGSQLNTLTPVVIFNNTVKLDLENIYGASNVTKLP